MQVVYEHTGHVEAQLESEQPAFFAPGCGGHVIDFFLQLAAFFAFRPFVVHPSCHGDYGDQCTQAGEPQVGVAQLHFPEQRRHAPGCQSHSR